MGKRSNFRTTVTSCLLSVLVALSGAISPAQANASVPADGEYVCTTGDLIAGDDTSPTYTITAGVVSAADDCTGAVTIASGVTEIAESAFEGASGMTSVSIPASATVIGPCDMAATSITVDSANPNYSSINGVLFNKAGTSLVAYPTANEEISYSIPASVTKITYCAFYKTKFLKSINIPNSVTSIEDWAFADSRNVETVTFAPGSPITRIEAFTFSSLVKLNSITLPSNLEFIVDYAFSNTTSLTSITIPAAVTSIGNSFAEATSLAAIYVDPSNQTYSSIDGVLFNKGATTLIKYPAGKTQTSYTIPASVTRITRAFESVNSLTSITIPASVATIEDNSFYVTPPLMDFYFLGDAPTNLESDAFAGIASGARARISATATGFGTDALWNGLEIVRATAIPAPGQYVCTTGEPRASGDMSLAYTITAAGEVTSGGDCADDVVLPDGVTSIGEYAFNEAESVTSINIPSSVTTIGSLGFMDSGLTSITFSEGSQLTTIGMGALSYTPLTSITIPAGVTTIARGAFEGSALIDVNFLGNAPTTVGENAFARIASGAKANISATATGFGTQPTWNALVIVRALPANGAYVCTTGVLRTDDDNSPTYTITNGVVSSGVSCAGAVLIPEGVTSIRYNAFGGASGLTSITIPASVTSIGEYAFAFTPALSSITFAQGSQLTRIDQAVFYEATALTSISIPAGVSTIGRGAFYDSALIDFNFLGNAPTTVIENAFAGIASGAKANIGADATGFGTDATWNGLVIVRAVPVPANGQYVCTTGEPRASGDMSLAYTITSGVVTSGGSCTGRVVVPAGVTAIGDQGFYSASSLTSISLPDGITRIGNNAFNGARALTSISIPASVTTIDPYAFYDTTALTSITIPASVTAIGTGALQGTTALTSITVESENQNFTSSAGVLFDKNATTVIHYPSGKGLSTYSIPASVTSIGSSAFQGEPSLTSITIPEGVTSIGSRAFLNAKALTSITVPAGVTSIGDYVFYGSTTLKSFYFQGNAPTLGTQTFGNITSGAKAHISATATGFGTDATWNGLEIVRPIPVPANGQYVCTTGEPRASGDMSLAYTITAGEVTSGGSCAGALVIAPGVTQIGREAFRDATALSSVTIPSSVTNMQFGAFARATALTSITFAPGSQLTYLGSHSLKYTSITSITIPAGVTSIESSTFEGATKLTSITIPAGVTRIGYDVFKGATALKSIYFKGNAPTLGFNSFGTIVSGVKAYVGATATGFGTESTWFGLVIARAPEDASYVCTTGEVPASGNSFPTYTITAGVVTDGASCAGAVVFPANITEIGGNAFYGASGLSSISIPASVTSIGVYAICETAVTSITVDSANPNYASQDGVLFNKDLTTLIAYPSGNAATSYVVPSSVTTIDDSSFYKSLFLKSITIPNSVTSILAYAFASSPNLETVAYASDSPITDIAEETFYGLPKLRSIELPPNLESIGSRALESLPLLTTITIPASVNFVGVDAFVGNASLVSIYFLGDAPATVVPGAFGSGAPSATAYIRPGATGYALDSNQKWNGLNVSSVSNTNTPSTSQPTTPSTSQTPANSVSSSATTEVSTKTAKFPAGSSALTGAGKKAIKKIVSNSGKDATYTVTAVASKSLGVPDSNVKGLAKARAAKVKAYLIKLGVAKSSITIKIKIVDSGVIPKTKILAKYLT